MNEKKLEILVTLGTFAVGIISTGLSNWIVKNEIKKQINKSNL